MNTFLKYFTIVVIIISLVLMVVTVGRYLETNQNTSNESEQFFSGVDSAVSEQDRQQAIQPDTSTMSSEVKMGITKLVNTNKELEDPMNDGDYILVDNRGNCLTKEACASTANPQKFSVMFDSDHGLFYIRILDIPTRTAILDAGSYLQDLLDINSADLCDLQYYMSVSERVDKQFAGQHLKFANCE